MAKGKKTGGRQRGSQNRVTLSVKQALLQAFEEKGGVPALLDWAEKEPGQFYNLWGRLAPREVNAEVNVAMLTPDERRQRLLALLGQ